MLMITQGLHTYLKASLLQGSRDFFWNGIRIF
jgi:hypothetical protein